MGESIIAEGKPRVILEGGGIYRRTSAISFALMVAALFIVLSHTYSPQDKHWAYGTLGMILVLFGYEVQSRLLPSTRYSNQPLER